METHIATNIKNVRWKWAYYMRMASRVDVSFSFAWESAGEALKDIDFDTSYCPEEAADTELSYWDD